MRYYYKSKVGKGYLNLKTPLEEGVGNYIQITEQEFNELTKIEEYIPTKEEIAKQEKLNRINELKKLLSSTDYQAIKYAEGLITEEEYEPIKTQRQAWRNEINELEATL